AHGDQCPRRASGFLCGSGGARGFCRISGGAAHACRATARHRPWAESFRHSHHCRACRAARHSRLRPRLWRARSVDLRLFLYRHPRYPRFFPDDSRALSQARGPLWASGRGARMTKVAALSALALLVLAPLMVQGTYYPFLGIIIFIYGIVAVGLNILAGYAGQFSLGHAALMAMGAYTTAILSKALASYPFFAATGLHIWLGVLAGTIVAAAFGALLAFPALRVRGPYLAMVTIAFGWVIYKILQEWVTVTGGDLGLASIPKAQAGSYVFDTHAFYYIVLALFVLALALQYRLVTSELGLRIRAMKHNEIAVSSLGIDVYRLKVLVFVISAAFAGFG